MYPDTEKTDYLSGVTGYGRLIEERRNLVPMTRKELGDRLGQSDSTIRRFELEQGGPPDRDQVNALVAALPLTAEELLAAMGYHMNPPAALRIIPHELLMVLTEMSPEEHRWLLGLLSSVRGRPRVRR